MGTLVALQAEGLFDLLLSRQVLRQTLSQKHPGEPGYHGSLVPYDGSAALKAPNDLWDTHSGSAMWVVGVSQQPRWHMPHMPDGALLFLLAFFQSTE